MKVIQAISGYKAPCLAPYWHEVEQVEDFDSVEIYSQMKTYYPGDMVNYLNTIYECDIQNGYEFNDIRIPGVIAWEMDEHARWAAISYDLWQIVQYEGLFYVLFDKNGYDYLENPADSDCWGQIGDYDPELNNYELNEREYVVYQNRVFHPVINPNSDVPQIDANIAISDPRNYNLKRHMTQLAMYELHKLISPNNISQVRVDDRDMTLQWLRDAGRLKINPQIPRKVDKDKKPITDWQMAAFQTEYNPYQNPWHI